ncbi:MAG: metalloregulator ArsR/SmtB family transcription factor [Verrucomicrobiota bacterium]|nr:metalloregulator ArsR/SmtB family transcription factor [Verrucomicrobiota bacterium]
MKLRPTLWRTCRVIANETRLKLLWHIFAKGELCVSQLVQRTGATQPNASNQLRALSARGLITYRREKNNVIYRAEANNGVDFAPDLLEALRQCHERSMSFKTVIRQATAFTHERRIEIVRALNGRKLSFGGLRDTTGISPAALSRHLEKLETRGFIKRTDGLYRIGWPGNPLGRTLVDIARY